MNIVIAVAIFWITLVAANKHFSHSFKYDIPDNYDILNSANSSEAATDDNEGNSSVARTTVPQSPSSSVRIYAAAGSALPSGTSSLSSKSLSSTSITLNAHEIEAMNRVLQKTTTISKSTQVPEVTKQITVPETDTTLVANSTNNDSSADEMLTNATSGSTTSHPDVVLSTKETKTYFDDILKQSVAWLGDTYTLSIVLPILGGFLFAMMIICTLYTFACIRRRCRRRRLRKKILPDTIRKMGASDRARLLAETSDEEF